jgi:hypothetical protein
MATHYEILGIETDADRTAVKKAYFRLCRTYHPDVSGDANGHFFKLVTAAYETLSDEKARARYDRELNDSNRSGYQSSDYDYDDDSQSSSASSAPSPDSAPHHTEGLIQNPPLDFGRMKWYNKDYSGLEEKVVLRHPNMLLAITGTIVFILGVLVLGLLSLVTHPPFLVIIYLVFAIGAIFTQNKFSRFRMGQANFIAVMTVWVAGYIWTIVKDIQSSHFEPNVFMLLFFTAGFGFLGLYSGHKWRKWSILKMDRGHMVLSAKDAKEFAIWGQPGELSDAIDKFGQRNVALGAIGEKRTAELLSNLFLIPGTKVFHGLKFPGSEDADVDHAVVNGNKIAFIDSKMWAGGHYGWSSNGTIIRDKKYDSLELHTNFPTAVKKLDDTLFHEADSRGWILIHSNDNRQVRTDNSNAGAVRLGTPQECLEEIGDWFAEGNTGIVNRGILNAIIHKMK